MIKVNNLTKTYKLYSHSSERLKEALNPFKKKYHNDFYALNKVSFEIKKGERLGIIGKNGSGKSTLLKLITGVLTPSTGTLHVKGKISAILELGAGFNPEMTGLENIYLNSTLNGMTQDKTKENIKAIVDFSELGDFIHQPVKTYSSGMKARLAFGVSIHVEPDILIIDEALSVGDAAFQRKCFAKINDMRDQGVTIIFVSHSDAQVVELCDRAIWLHKGEILLDGVPKLVTSLYQKYSTTQNQNKLIIKHEYEKLLANINQKEKISTARKEYFNETIQSKSLLSYEENGAKIFDIHITTLDNDKVNILNQGEKYIYRYKVIYKENFSKVRLGMNIKTKSGFILGGGQYPYNKTKEGTQVKAGVTYEMQWEFTCNLGEGTYFTNSGTYCLKNEKQLHRVMDAYMFEVKENAQTLSAGNVKFIYGASINEL